MKDFDALLKGYRQFRAGDWQAERARWDELAGGQSPRILVIACSDSRVDPAVLFEADPGDIFVVRNVAAIVPPFDGAAAAGESVASALEYAVTQLKVPEIVVMGHESCGGVGACLNHSFAGAARGEGGCIDAWVEQLAPARERAIGGADDAAKALELESVRQSIANLMTYPFVADRVDAGALSLRGTYFAIGEGVLHVMDDDGSFDPVTD